jgi:hypothetical protein
MDTGQSSWNASAAYLYILALDGASLAWEYLRRNLTYQAHWRKAEDRSDSSIGDLWGLRHLEDPRRDGRAAEPPWCPTPSSSVWLIRLAEPDPCARFQFWRIPGDKSLVHDGMRLLLTARHHPAVKRAVLAPDLAADEPYAFSVPAGNQVQTRCRAVNEFVASYHTTHERHAKHPVVRPSRSALTHMRVLQALDGSRAGASQRDIAAAIFGASHVNTSWAPDSELRAQTRYLLKRGEALAKGGYRTLLNADSS